MDERGLQPGWKRTWGESFDAVADAYDAARPGYPTRLYRDLRDLYGLKVESRVLEVGCGTGQATVDLAPLAGSVVALEPGVSLAEKAKIRLRDLRNAEVIVSTFEDFDGEPDSFDLVVSATAFHWVDPEVGFPLAARLLRRGGWLSLFWHVYHDPDGEDPFGEEVRGLFRDVVGHERDDGPEYALRTTERVSDFARSGLFGPVEMRRYRWRGEHGPGEIRALFSTFSNVQSMNETTRERILSGIEEIAKTKFDGRVSRPYVTALYAARKVV